MANHQPNFLRGLLTTARDRQLQTDLGRQLQFPANIATTSLCADMVLTSESTKQVVLLELTVPWKTGLMRLMSARGLNTLSSLQSTGAWMEACSEPVEIGCRGLAGHSCQRGLKLLGVRGLQSRRATKNILRPQKRPQSDCGSVGGSMVCYMDTSQGLITPSWVAWERVYDDYRP